MILMQKLPSCKNIHGKKGEGSGLRANCPFDILTSFFGAFTGAFVVVKSLLGRTLRRF